MYLKNPKPEQSFHLNDNHPRLRLTHRWNSSRQFPDSPTKTFWQLKSSNRIDTLVKYLQIKALLGFCSVIELQALVDYPRILGDRLFIEALRAWKTDVPESILWQRLQLLQRLTGRSEWSKNLFYTLSKVVNYELELKTEAIRRVKKYSGYVKNSSSVGSKRPRTVFLEETESIQWVLSEDINYYEFLTVGEYYLGNLGRIVSHPDED
jgi:hypothetical protein